MPSTGAKAGGTATNVDNNAGTAWTNPSSALDNNNTYAVAAAPKAADDCDYLHITNFGFAVDAGAVIDGVEVVVHRGTDDNNSGSSNFYTYDHTIQLIKGGTRAGDNKADVATRWPAADPVSSAEAPRTYGGNGDLWGLTLTPADVNASTFGVAIAAALVNIYSNANVDFVTINIYYHTPAGSSCAQVII